MTARITKTKHGFKITHRVCSVCGEPPFGGEYCCGHAQNTMSDIAAENARWAAALQMCSGSRECTYTDRGVTVTVSRDTNNK